MNFSERIKIIGKEIYYEEICDIGTDHCYLPIYAYKIGKIKKAIACDISKNSLDKAKKNIKYYNCEDYIETRLSYGLEKIKEKEVNTIVISGMGGYNIIDILEKSNSNLLKNIKQLILQPQSGIKEVRKYIHKIGFKIINEEFIKESNKYYNIINCLKGKDEKYKNIDYLLGKILLKKREKLFLEYVEKEYNKIINLLKNYIECKNKELKHENIIEEEKYITLKDECLVNMKESTRESIKELKEKLNLFKEVLYTNDYKM